MTMTREEAIMRLKQNRAAATLYAEMSNRTKTIENELLDIEAIDMAIEALQAEPTHGRLIDADALMEYCSNQKTKTISNNDIARFPTVQAARPTGEWIFEETDEYKRTYCSVCGVSAPFVCVSDDHYGRRCHGETRKTKFCPNCGARMKGDTE